MTNNILITKPLDSIIINVDKDDELGFWSNKLKCDCEELKAIIYKVGASLKEVRLYLRNLQAD